MSTPNTPLYIDTHTHLFVKQFKDDIDQVIQKSIERGVQRFYLPNIDAKTFEAMYQLTDAYPENCFPMMGIHPCSIKDDFKEVLEKTRTELEGNRKFWAVGEIGLDYYWDLTHKEQQKEALKIQIEWAKEYNLPIVLHTRDSFEDTYEIVKNLNDENLTGVFHCFTGSLEDAQKVMDLGGFYMGIGGVVTFKNAGVDKTVAEIPLEYLVLETDSPYLAPVPYRGKRNESTYIPDIAQRIADVKSISVEQVAQSTSQNALKLFQAN